MQDEEELIIEQIEIGPMQNFTYIVGSRSTREVVVVGVDLMLCGHTHNGQIMPFNLLVRRFFPTICGLYNVGGLTLYVSPGSGTWGPVLRLGSRCEISMIHLG